MTPDTDALAARLRKKDAAAIDEAYGRVFGTELGRFVLANILQEAGVGTRRPRDMTPDQRTYQDGAAFVALAIADKAKFDGAAVVASVVTDTPDLKGRDYERDDDAPGSFSGPHRPERYDDDDLDD